MVAFNSIGIIVHGIAMRVWCSSATTREALTVLAVIKLASEADFTSIECATDSTIVYDVLHCTTSYLPWNIKATRVAILEISSRLYRVSFYHIPHQFNTSFSKLTVVSIKKCNSLVIVMFCC